MQLTPSLYKPNKEKATPMQNSGDSEFSSTNGKNPKLSVGFWQIFLLTLSGAAGFISLASDGPGWLTYSGLGLVLVVLFWIIYENRKKN
jgi:hypothetical protein